MPDGYTLAGERSGDLTGSGIAVGDLDGDGQADVLIGANGSTQGALSGGAVYVVPGPITTDVSLTDHPMLVGAFEAGFAGESVAFLGDLDGDGYGDAAIGASLTSNSGHAYVIHGPITADGMLDAVADVWTGEAETDAAGFSVGGGGDLTGDGVPDVAIGAELCATYTSGGGSVYVVSGSATGGGSLHSASARIYGDTSYEFLGSAVVAHRDLDGDGTDDLVVGASGYAGNAGAALVFHGPLSGLMLASAADATLYGHASSYEVAFRDKTLAVGDVAAARFLGDAARWSSGASLEGAQDVTGDGVMDLLVGSPGADGDTTLTGIVSVIPGT